MALKKWAVNLIFAGIIAALGLTAAGAIYLRRGSSANKPPAVQESAGSQLPENHPSTESIEQLMALEQKFAQDPQNADYAAQIANLYYDFGQYDKAADFYQKSLDIHPGVSGVETDLGACFYYLGQYDKALKILDEVLRRQPGYPQAMFNKGVVLAYGTGDKQGAINIWEDLSRSDPAFSQRAELEQKIDQLRTSVK
jgi:tetratricopeptide (TPR) repeat protein